MEKDEIIKMIDEQALKVVTSYFKQNGFIDRKLADTPTDDLMVTPRKYVNMFGSVASRPQNSVIGQQFFNTTVGYPIFRNSNNAWVSATGSVVG